jgi:preprotein translocase SecE subunit
MNQQADQQAGGRPTGARPGQEQSLSFWRYKPAQGYWTRTMSFLGLMAVACAGAGWLWKEFEGMIYVQGIAAAIMVLAALGVGWYLLNKPRIVDFMIATEAEMKKVNWPSKRDIVGSTWLVIAGTFMLAILLFAIDLVFSTFFLWIDVIQTTPAG